MIKRQLKAGLHTHLIDRLAIVNGLVSGLALYPQLLKIMVMRDSDSISAVTYGVIFSNSVVWVAYSAHRGLLSLLIASLLNMLASFALFLVAFVPQ